MTEVEALQSYSCAFYSRNCVIILVSLSSWCAHVLYRSFFIEGTFILYDVKVNQLYTESVYPKCHFVFLID